MGDEAVEAEQKSQEKEDAEPMQPVNEEEAAREANQNAEPPEIVEAPASKPTIVRNPAPVREVPVQIALAGARSVESVTRSAISDERTSEPVHQPEPQDEDVGETEVEHASANKPPDNLLIGISPMAPIVRTPDPVLTDEEKRRRIRRWPYG